MSNMRSPYWSDEELDALIEPGHWHFPKTNPTRLPKAGRYIYGKELKLVLIASILAALVFVGSVFGIFHILM